MNIDDFLEKSSGVGSDDVPTNTAAQPQEPSAMEPQEEASSGKEKKSADTTIDQTASVEQQMHQVLMKFQEVVHSDDIAAISQMYGHLQRVLHKVTSEKVLLEKDIVAKLQKSNQILLAQLQEMSERADRNIAEINKLVQKGRSLTSKGSLKTAMQIYVEVKKLYQDLPEKLNEKKIIAQQSLLNFYLLLRERLNEQAFERLKTQSSNINRLLVSAKYMARKERIIDAQKYYREACRIYASLPEGFLQQKAVLYSEMLKVYNEIHISYEVSTLQKNLVSLHKHDPIHIQRSSQKQQNDGIVEPPPFKKPVGDNTKEDELPPLPS
ncbi:MAG: hypothetical protein ACOCWQ_02930 [Nanoarchaeota archaeon]